MSEDLFFCLFCSSLDFRQEKRTDCGCKNFHSGLSYSQIFGISWLLATTCYLSAHGQPLKGGESSSRFRWFTIAKLEQ